MYTRWNWSASNREATYKSRFLFSSGIYPEIQCHKQVRWIYASKIYAPERIYFETLCYTLTKPFVFYPLFLFFFLSFSFSLSLSVFPYARYNEDLPSHVGFRMQRDVILLWERICAHACVSPIVIQPAGINRNQWGPMKQLRAKQEHSESLGLCRLSQESNHR